jgi:hypothetical protein
MIQTRYRADYEGEFVITETRWAAGKKHQIREWIVNPIENHHLSGRAICIGSDFFHTSFDYTRLQRHRGGLLGSKKLQTYGIGSITHNMRLDFAVELQQENLDNIRQRKYQENNIVYTTARLCIQNPGEFYLIPYNPVICQEAAILYLAAFDGHKEIFLFGYNNDMPAGNTAWDSHVASVIRAYPLTQFIIVADQTTIPAKWLNFSNTRCITKDQFVSYCDV